VKKVIETKKQFSLFGSIWKHSEAFGSIRKHFEAFESIWKHLEARCFRCFALFEQCEDKTANKTVSFQILPEQGEQFSGLNHFFICPEI